MATMTLISDQTTVYEVQTARQIREKIKEVFDWNCPMNDAGLLRRYTMDSDGDLVMIVR